jgi:hypothetical protein
MAKVVGLIGDWFMVFIGFVISIFRGSDKNGLRLNSSFILPRTAIV